MQKAQTILLDQATICELRGCLAICLYNIAWAPADDWAAEVTAEQIREGRTALEHPERVPALLRLALQEPEGLLENLCVPHDKQTILAYLENLHNKLVNSQ